MTTSQQVSPIRGAIKTSISASTDVLVAGQDFSIFITVQNPFEVPLALHRISTFLPTEFIDIDKASRELQIQEVEQQIANLEDAGQYLGLPAKTFIPSRPSFFLRIFQNLADAFRYYLLAFLGVEPDGYAGPAVARDVSGNTTETQLNIGIPFVNITQTIKKELKTHPEQEDKALLQERLENELRKYNRILKELQFPPERSKILQAGNSTARLFTIRSRRSVWFRPASYKLQIEVEYEIAGTRNVDTIEHPLQVKASLTSMVLGAILGGLGGWFTSKGASIKLDTPAIISLSVSLVLAAMTVVLFARKKDVQPLIAIEDFWGGVAIGFLAAYSGPQIFRGLFGN
jgi:hypothetical protein